MTPFLRSVSLPGLALAGVLATGALSPAAAATWPLDPVPRVVHDFDPPRSSWGAGHRGVDLAGLPGQPVRAAAAGTVTHAAGLAGRGTVTVTHGAVRTTYEPVAPAVARGDQVREGQVIGHLQVVGGHCFPRTCLHWGALRGETYLDPLLLVGAGPVRLKPLGGLPPTAPPRWAPRFSPLLRLVGVPVGMPSASARW